MTAWDVLDKFISSFPPIAATILLAAAVVVFIIGFSRRGLNFIKYGFGQTTLDSSLENRFDNLASKMAADMGSLAAKMAADMDSLAAKMATRDDISRLDAKIEAIEVNHFGHLKDFLTELTSILLDRGVINNTDKARLDNQLRGM
jgi:hypothetical protein